MKLNASRRDAYGKERAGRLRAEGKLPAVVYGHRTPTAALVLDGHEFQRVFARAGRNQLIDLVVDGGRAHKVLVKEVQVHPRVRGPVHVDLQQVSMREKLQVDVPLAVAGESPAVKRGEGDLLQTVHSVRVECLPGDIPEQLELDVSGLDSLEAGIRAGELRLAPGVTLLTDADELLVKVTPRRELAAEVEEAPEPAEAAAEEPGEAPAPGEPGEES